MDARVRMCLAELIGTFALVLAGAGTTCALHVMAGARSSAGTALAVALAQGCTLAIVLSATWHVSPGCLNPAVTLMLWVFKRLEGVPLLLLVAMQLLGSLLAGLVLRAIFTDEVLRRAHWGAPHLKAFLGPDYAVTMGSMISGIGVEVCLTFLVATAVFATLLDPRRPHLGGVGVGMAQTAATLFGFWLTGGAANPALWFGPALWERTLPSPLPPGPLADHPVYWAGPVVGALAGGFFYSAVVLPPTKGTEPHS